MSPKPDRWAVTTIATAPRAPTTARTFTRRTLDTWACTGPVDDMVLVVSELVTNVVRHTRSAAVLRLERHAGYVRIECVDHGNGWIGMRENPDEDGGYGLRLVAQVASRWGAEMRTDQHLVWAEFDC